MIYFQVDIPIRILAQSLRGTWPKTGPKLAALLTEISSGFVLINRVLYLSSNLHHHEKIIDNLAVSVYLLNINPNLYNFSVSKTTVLMSIFFR